MFLLLCSFSLILFSLSTHTHPFNSFITGVHFAVVWFQEKYTDVASELIVYTYFFSASEDVLPEVRWIIFRLFCLQFDSSSLLCFKQSHEIWLKYVVLLQSVALHELPSVVVFKDGTYFTYDGTWRNRESTPNERVCSAGPVHCSQMYMACFLLL